VTATGAAPPPSPSPPSPRGWPGRFERKILAALFAVALLSLCGAAVLLRATLGSVSELTSQHQHQVRRSLDDAVEAYRTFFAAAKEGFRQRAQNLANRRLADADELAAEPDLLSAELLEGARVLDRWEAPPARASTLREAPPLIVENRASGPNRRLALTFGIRREVYANFLTLRGAMDQELELDRVFPLVMPRLYQGLALALGVVLVVASVLGLALARRATRRVAALREASRRVAAGDLGVRIAPRGHDELDDLGRAFDQMVAELAATRSRLGYLEKVSAWQEVARRLAHEIKNPLTPIQLVVQQLGSQYKGDDERYRRLLADAADILGEEVGVIRRLVDDFSAFAKLPRVEPSPLDLGAVIRDFERTPGPWTGALEVDVPALPAPIHADKMLLRRVLANLVENALQAIASDPAKAIPARVRLSVRVERASAAAAEGFVWLLVDDNGPGVAPSRHARVFDPYFTTKEHGTGLGLAIVRKILLDHGGDIVLDDAPSPLGGARFRVRLPLATESAAPPVDEVSSPA
jgi:signal transduction histidine kinase